MQGCTSRQGLSGIFPSSPSGEVSAPRAAKPDGRLDGSSAKLLPLWCDLSPSEGQTLSWDKSQELPWVSLQQCEITAADSSCWGSSRYQTKSPMKTLAHGDGCQKFSWAAVDPKQIWAVMSLLIIVPLNQRFKPDAAINTVKVLATPAQIHFQTQGLKRLHRHTWGQNLALLFPPHAFSAYCWLPLTGTSWLFAFCLPWVWWAALYPHTAGGQPFTTCLFSLNWWNTQLGEKPASQFGRNGDVSHAVPFVM